MSKQEYTSNLSVLDTYDKGWNLFKKHFWMFIGIVLIAVAAEIVLRVVVNLISLSLGAQNAPMIALIIIPIILGFLGGFLFIAPIQIGVAWTILKAARKEKFGFNDVFASFKRNYKQIVIGSILSALIMGVGFILFIIPGIIFSIRLSFVSYLLIDKKMSARDAIKTSWEMTKPHGWTLFGMFLLAIPIILIGLLLLIIGVFAATAWLNATMAVFFMSVMGEQKKGKSKKKVVPKPIVLSQ